jgi:hypothetical protein
LCGSGWGLWQPGSEAPGRFKFTNYPLCRHFLFVVIVVLGVFWASQRNWAGYPIMIISLLHLLGSGFLAIYTYLLMLTSLLTVPVICLLAVIFDLVVMVGVATTLFRFRRAQTSKFPGD